MFTAVNKEIILFRNPTLPLIVSRALVLLKLIMSELCPYFSNMRVIVAGLTCVQRLNEWLSCKMRRL